MPPDPTPPSSAHNPETDSVPPQLPTSQPPVMVAPPPSPPNSPRLASSVPRLLAILLSVYLGLFLADGVISLVDDSLILFFDLHAVTLLRVAVGLPALLLAVFMYVLMGLTPMIPKRQFLPLTLFTPAATLLLVPFAIYFSGRLHQFAWSLSFCQVILGLSVLWWVLGGFKFRWLLVAENRLEVRRFSWGNLIAFLLVNVLGLLPAILVYLVACAGLAVNHFSEGFVALRPVGLTVQVRTYVRNDGKTIRLVPMSHIGEPDFYRALSQSFPTNSIILMEGVTDNRNLLTNQITYQRMARTLGVTEQHKEFKPRGELVRADMDVEDFTKTTIGLLNLVMRLHSKGVDLETVLRLMQMSTPHNEELLLDDLVRKRNRHLLERIEAELSLSQNLIVPWGAAHMPEIAREIQKSGFRMEESQEYVAIRFRSVVNKRKGAGKAGKLRRVFPREESSGRKGLE